MRILITGASGFVGRNLIPRLEAAQVQILRVSAINSVGTDILLDDIWDSETFGATLKKWRPNAILHLAGMMKGDSAQEFFNCNFHYASTILSSTSQELPKARVILLGTSAEYGPIVSAEGDKSRESDPCWPDKRKGACTCR